VTGATVVEQLRALGPAPTPATETVELDDTQLLREVRQELAEVGPFGFVTRLTVLRLARVGDEEAWTLIGRHFGERGGYRAACDALGRGDLLAAATSCARANGLSFEEWLAAGGGR
jgi:hypothetical protein